MISIIIPTYNEAENIKRLVPMLDDVIEEDYEVIVVDDDSPDETWRVAKQLAGDYPVTSVRRKGKRGLATAVIRGFEEAQGEVVGVMDADLSHPAEAVPRVFKPVADGKAELSVGSRLVEGGGVEVWPWYRKIISLVATWMARPLTDVKDSMSGFFFMKPGVIEGVDLEPRGYKILLEVLVKGEYETVVEVPYVFKNRMVGESKLGFRVYFNYLRQLLELYAYMVVRG